MAEMVEPKLVEPAPEPEPPVTTEELKRQLESAVFWRDAHEQTSHSLSKQLSAQATRYEAQLGEMRAQNAGLERRVAELPPDMLPTLEKLLARIGFQFRPDRTSVSLVDELETIIAQIRKGASLWKST